MEIENHRGYSSKINLLEKLGGCASDYAISEDETEFIKIFYPDKNILFQRELLAINTIISLSHGKDNVPKCMLLPKKVIYDESNHYLVFETYPNTQDILTYLYDNNLKIDESIFKLVLKTFLDCFNWMSEHNLAHRDFKMENCLIWFDEFEKPTIKIIDFGHVSSCYDSKLLGTPNLWPIELQMLYRDHSTGQYLNLKSDKFKYSIKDHFLKCWNFSSLKIHDKENWERFNKIIEESDFTVHKRKTIKSLENLMFSTVFPTKPGTYHDMYSLIIVFKQFIILKERGNIEMSELLLNTLQKFIGKNSNIYWVNLKKQFDEGFEELMKIM